MVTKNFPLAPVLFFFFFLAPVLFPHKLKLGTNVPFSILLYFTFFFFPPSTRLDIALFSLAPPSTNHCLHLSNYRQHKSACPPSFLFQDCSWHDSALNHRSCVSVAMTLSSLSLGLLFFSFHISMDNGQSENDGLRASLLPSPYLLHHGFIAHFS